MNETMGTYEQATTHTLDTENEIDSSYVALTTGLLELVEAADRPAIENAFTNITTQSDPARTHNIMRLFELFDEVSRNHPEYSASNREAKSILYKTLEEIRTKEALLQNEKRN